MTPANIDDRLTNLLAVTDVRLTKLDVDDLLVEVLERLRSILEVDTAAVLLREHNADDLVARAARGLEDEVNQGVRVPIGVGFAGRIAATKQPVVLDVVDATTVANPILWEKGIRHMVGVPLLVGETLLGVVHVGRLQDRAFGQHDVELLQLAGERIASAVQTRRLAVESAAGAMLERELLPSQLPTIPGLHFAARYAPAEDRSIGGDWYDAFVLPSGALWTVIGDVAGHGLNSAVVVSRVKSALRSYAMLHEGPARVLELTNRKLMHFEIDTMVTLLCAVSTPPYQTFTVACAGHLPPVLATADDATLVPLTAGPPLGVDDVEYTSFDVDLPAESTLLLYTDGLVERRDQSIEVGLSRLREFVHSGPAEMVCRDVMAHMVGSTATQDDVAMMAIRRSDADEALGFAPADNAGGARQQTFPADPSSVAAARAFVSSASEDLDDELRGALTLLVSELATNCVQHAASDFDVRISRGKGRVLVECTDRASDSPVVRRAAPSELSGRGMFFVVRFAESWGVRHATVGKTVWFTLDITAPPSTRELSGLAPTRLLDRV